MPRYYPCRECGASLVVLESGLEERCPKCGADSRDPSPWHDNSDVNPVEPPPVPPARGEPKRWYENVTEKPTREFGARPSRTPAIFVAIVIAIYVGLLIATLAGVFGPDYQGRRPHGGPFGERLRPQAHLQGARQ
jgi:hypothetical protein